MTKWFSFLLFKGFVLCSKRRDQAALRKPVHEETGNGNLFLILSLFLSKAKITDEKNNRKKKENKKISLRKKGGIKGRIEPINHLHSHYPSAYGANKRL